MKIIIMILLVVASFLTATLFSCMLAASQKDKQYKDAHEEKQNK